jgi:excisionase family DNA binding protein
MKEEKTENPQKYFSLEEAAHFLKLSKSFLYKLTMNRVIPHYKPNGKKIYFDVNDLEKFITKNRIISEDALKTKAANYLVND